MKKYSISLLIVCLPVFLPAQDNSPVPRYRVIIDNDMGGDPDGLLDLAHQLLSPSTEVRAIIASEHNPAFPPVDDPVGVAVEEINRLLSVMGLEDQVPVYRGSNEDMTVDDPADCAGAQAIINEAMRSDTDAPLFVVCGGSLKTIASAWLIKPAIAEKLTLVWIGGGAGNGDYSKVEPNLNSSIPGARVIFNQSDIPVWQVPREAYVTTMMSKAEMQAKFAASGELGEYLVNKILARMNMLAGYFKGETYTMGDNPLTLLTALQAYYESEAKSSQFINVKAPIINEDGSTSDNPAGRIIRMYTELDIRLMFDDLEAKLILWGKGKKP